MAEPIETQGNQFQPFLLSKTESGSENVHYSILYEELPEEYKLIAEKELGETEEKKKKGIQELKKFMESENIKGLSSNILIATLRSCKYDLKKAKSKLKTFEFRRSAFLGSLVKLDMDTAERILEDMSIGALPYRDKHGRVIIYSRACMIDPESYNGEETSLCATALFLFLLSFPITTIAGVTYFCDCKPPPSYLYFTVLKTFERQCWNILSFPIRIRRVEIMNEIHIIRWFYRILKPFLPSKLLNRISFHRAGYDGIHKDYDRNMLPDAFGGTLGSISCDLYKNKLLDYISELKAEVEANVPTNKSDKT